MLYLILKAALSGLLSPWFPKWSRGDAGVGALIVSLPLVSILAIIWLWRDTGDVARIAAHAEATFWLVLPTLPMFLVFPAMLRGGVGFWAALIASCLLTIALYVFTVWLLPKFGIGI